MINVLEPQKVRDTTSQAARALVCIDLGNGDVKAVVRMPGVDSWVPTKFASTVCSNAASTFSVATADGKKTFSVGNDSALADSHRTGQTKDGKVENALPLLIHAIRQTVEIKHMDKFHCDVIFTSPSNAAYRERITSELKGIHSVSVAADETDLDSFGSEFAIDVHNAFGQLEGLRAIHLVSEQVEGEAYLIDIGHRTTLITRVNGKGVVQNKDRRLLDDRGVYAIAREADRREVMAEQMCFSAQDVITAAFDRKNKKVAATALADIFTDTLGDAIAALDSDIPRFLVGGGAGLPGIDKLFKGTVIDNPQWASLHGLASVADKVIAHAQRRAK